MTNLIKGKLNKLRVGQKVKAKPQLVNWFTDHLSWSYGRPPKDTGYGENEKEIDAQDLHKVYAWTDARLSGEMPIGVVTHYGAKDNDNGVDRNNVHIQFTFETKIGKIVDGTYVHEKNLIAVKKKSRKR